LGSKLAGESAEWSEDVRFARRSSRRIHRVAAAAHGRVAATVKDEIALHDAVHHPPGGIEARVHDPVARKERGRDGTDHDLCRTRRHEQTIRVPTVELAASVVHYRDAPEKAAERRLVEPLIQSSGKGL
jgi:hypothetical protein